MIESRFLAAFVYVGLDMDVDIIAREAILDQLAGRSDGVTLLVGDSGVGKTSILAVASEHVPGRPHAPLGRISARDGALAIALAEQIASVLAESREENPQSAQEALARVVGAVRGEMGRVVAKTVIGYVVSKVGQDAVDSIKRMHTDLSKDSDAILEQS